MLPLTICMVMLMPPYPGKTWERRTPEQVGLSREKLDALKGLVGGRGCVVRHGYLAYSWGDIAKSADIASAVKPIISALLLCAVQEGRLKSVDDPVAVFEPRLKTLNGGKDARITWRHLASQTSGYGLAEAPGRAYSYNDFALALYYDTLTQKVFREKGTPLLKSRFADALQFEDAYTFEAFGSDDLAGRLAISVQDLARFGLLILRGGRWRNRQILRPDLLRMMLSSPVPSDTPLSGGKEADMLPGQRTLGGRKNITPVGPGYYSFNWWLNRTDRAGKRLFVDAPSDTILASGHGGMRTLWIFPGLDMIVCWNDSGIDDHDASPGNPDSRCNRAARLMVEAVQHAGGRAKAATKLGIQGERFTLNGRPTFLLGISYYGALGAPEDSIRRDLDQMQEAGFNWLRVWATWSAFGSDVSAVDAEGRPREPFLTKLKQMVAECDRRGLIVDVTLSRGSGLPSQQAHRRAVETLVGALKPWRNWYLDMANERNVRDSRYVSFEELRELRETVRRLDPARLVTASQGGDIGRAELREYLQTAQVDFICPHRPRDAASPADTEAKTHAYRAWLRELGRVVPLHYQEPFRRGYGDWQPRAEDFLTDLRAAMAAGAAGWCFHNGDTRRQPDGQPRRSFDMRQKGLFDQLDEEERKFVEGLRKMTTQPKAAAPPKRRTEVAIRGEQFYINGKPTYAGRTWQGHRIEGLLLNARLVQGIFDDLNSQTRHRWAYPDTGTWDPERNTREFIAAMPEWRRHGLLAFTINLQGGSPTGYANEQPWHNSAITEEGELRPDYMARLERILDRADELGMVVILGVFYFGQDQRLKDEAAVVRALDNAVHWVLERGYRNVLIEVNNECNVRYDHPILQPGRVHELIERVKTHRRDGRRLLVSTSYGGGTIPGENVVRSADFLLLHGNGVGDPDEIAAMVRKTRQVPGYRPMPILFNEDDHFDFEKPKYNMAAAIGEYASWGYFDYRMRGEDFEEGYQSVPVNWSISSARKRAFFARLKEITGAE